MMAIPFTVHPEAPTFSRGLGHFDHAVAVMGIAHVGLGADFIDQLAHAETVALAKASLGLEGFTAPDDFPALVVALRRRGYDAERLEAILSANWLRILRAALPA